MTKYLLPMLAALLFSFSAHAGRNFPPNAQAGDLKGVQNPYVKIGDKTYRLSPGSHIYDRFNRIVLPVSAPQTGKVMFQLDSQGFLHKLWVLTPEEEAALAR